MKGINHKEQKRPVYKCTYCKIIGHLEPFCFDKFKRFKGNHLRYFETNETFLFWAQGDVSTKGESLVFCMYVL